MASIGPIIALFMVLMGCQTINRDKSPTTAIDAGDKSLIHSACHAGPTVGFDICKVHEGRKIKEVWKLIVPFDNRVDYGAIRVQWKNKVKTYRIKSVVVSIPFRDIIGENVWKKDHEAPIQAQVGLKLKNSNGESQWVDLLGYAFPIVLTESYKPFFMDSGDQYFETRCKIQYTTAGRSDIRCK